MGSNVTSRVPDESVVAQQTPSVLAGVDRSRQWRLVQEPNISREGSRGRIDRWRWQCREGALAGTNAPIRVLQVPYLDRMRPVGRPKRSGVAMFMIAGPLNTGQTNSVMVPRYPRTAALGNRMDGTARTTPATTRSFDAGARGGCIPYPCPRRNADQGRHP